MNEVAPMIVAVVLILTVGGVTLLRPLASRLGALLEVMTQERMGRGGSSDRSRDHELARIRELMESVHDRLVRLEERQDFTDALLQKSERPKLEPGPPRERSFAWGEGRAREPHK